MTAFSRVLCRRSTQLGILASSRPILTPLFCYPSRLFLSTFSAKLAPVKIRAMSNPGKSQFPLGTSINIDIYLVMISDHKILIAHFIP